MLSKIMLALAGVGVLGAVTLAVVAWRFDFVEVDPDISDMVREVLEENGLHFATGNGPVESDGGVDDDGPDRTDKGVFARWIAGTPWQWVVALLVLYNRATQNFLNTMTNELAAWMQLYRERRHAARPPPTAAPSPPDTRIRRNRGVEA